MYYDDKLFFSVFFANSAKSDIILNNVSECSFQGLTCIVNVEALKLLIAKMVKFLNQCFARLQFWKSVKNHETSFSDFLHFSKTEVVQNTDLRI